MKRVHSLKNQHIRNSKVKLCLSSMVVNSLLSFSTFHLCNIWLTICTVWLNSSLSAVMEEIWSIRRCFLEKNRSRRVLSERQDATLDLYSSFSLFTTEWRVEISLTILLASFNYDFCLNLYGLNKMLCAPCLTVDEG